MPSEARSEQVIRRGECYTLSEFLRRAGIGKAAMRTARRRGLKTHRVGTRTFVVGDDWLAFLDASGRAAAPN